MSYVTVAMKSWKLHAPLQAHGDSGSMSQTTNQHPLSASRQRLFPLRWPLYGCRFDSTRNSRSGCCTTISGSWGSSVCRGSFAHIENKSGFFISTSRSPHNLSRSSLGLEPDHGQDYIGRRLKRPAGRTKVAKQIFYFRRNSEAPWKAALSWMCSPALPTQSR